MLSKSVRITISLLLLLFSITVVCQNILILEKFNHKKNYIYKVDNSITLEFKNQKIASGIITRIADSIIVLDGLSYININEIEYVVRKRHGFYQLWNLFFKKIALGYFAITTINRTIRDEQPIFNTANMIIVGSAAIIGIAGKLLYVKRYKIDTTHWRFYPLIHYDFPAIGVKK